MRIHRPALACLVWGKGRRGRPWSGFGLALVCPRPWHGSGAVFQGNYYVLRISRLRTDYGVLCNGNRHQSRPLSVPAPTITKPASLPSLAVAPSRTPLQLSLSTLTRPRCHDTPGTLFARLECPGPFTHFCFTVPCSTASASHSFFDLHTIHRPPVTNKWICDHFKTTHPFFATVPRSRPRSSPLSINNLGNMKSVLFATTLLAATAVAKPLDKRYYVTETNTITVTIYETLGQTTPTANAGAGAGGWGNWGSWSSASTPPPSPASPAPTGSPSPAPPAGSGAPDAYASAMLEQHNIHRSNHSASPLVWDSDLAGLAQQVAQSCVYAHDT